MHVQLKRELDTDPDAAWRALRSATVMRELYGPLLDVDVDAGTQWHGAAGEAALSFAGFVPLGRQLIDLEYDESRHAGIRMLRDSGTPVSGPLSVLRGWNHRMAVSAVPDAPGRTLLRDRLTFHGPAAAALWYPLWAVWQWRGARLQSMAPTWAFDPELQAD